MLETVLLAATPPESTLISLGLMAVVVAVFFFSLLLLLVNRYKRCPSNRILVIYGKVGGGNTARCIHGGAAFVMPLVQDYAFLNLEPIHIQVPLQRGLCV